MSIGIRNIFRKAVFFAFEYYRFSKTVLVNDYLTIHVF